MGVLRWIVGLAWLTMALTGMAGTVLQTVPDLPNPALRYLFYLHGRSVDDGSARSLAAYGKTVDALSALGPVVVSEARTPGTFRVFPDDYDTYARKIAGQVGMLLASGVPASHVVVVGYSRGGTLALMVSAHVGNPLVRYVVMAGCMAEQGAYKEALPVMYERYAPRLRGRILSLRDSGDKDFGSCDEHVQRAVDTVVLKEMTLSTGKGHFAFAEPVAEWLEPVRAWSLGE